MARPVAELEARLGTGRERRHGQLAPGSHHLELGGGVRCGRCGLAATTAPALRLHRTTDGRCLDPQTDRGPRGAALMLPAAELGDGTVIWGWPDRRRAA